MHIRAQPPHGFHVSRWSPVRLRGNIFCQVLDLLAHPGPPGRLQRMAQVLRQMA